MPLQLDDLAALDAPTLEANGQPLMLPVEGIDEDPENRAASSMRTRCKTCPRQFDSAASGSRSRCARTCNRRAAGCSTSAPGGCVLQD